MGRDLVARPYGRFYYLPQMLASRGHRVTVFLLSYAREPDIDMQRDGVRWLSTSIWPLGPWRYWRRALALSAEHSYDWAIGLSDTYFGILAESLARRTGCRSAIDAYDNYEAYLPSFQWLHRCWRTALQRADVVTAAGPNLAELMSRGRTTAAHIIPMAADPIGFDPMDRARCRQHLKLDPGERLVGYCGALYRNRGIETLFDAFELAQLSKPNIKLVLTGRKQRGVKLPPRAIWLGLVDDPGMPAVLNSMDLLTVINRASLFGEYSYPVKLYEAMSCSVPLVASDTTACRWILQDHPELLVPPGDPVALAERIVEQLQRDRIDYGPPNTWERSAALLDHALQE